jgi:nucleoside-diphosphate-sugar epimerase
VTATQGSYPTLTGLGAKRLVAGPWRIVVAGAGGWIGLAAVEELHELLGEDFHRRVVCFGSSHRWLSLRGGLRVEQRPLSEIGALPFAPTLVLYLAFLTQEKAGMMSREAYVTANEAISDLVFNNLDKIGAEAVFVASSGAVEMVGVPGAHENKALYGDLKLKDEARFAAWASERGRRTVIARIFGLSGAYINKLDSYALACFIVDVLAGRPIDIKAAHPVFRSYVAVDELMSVVFALMTDGASGTTLFDTGADRGYEMSEIAEGVAEALGHRHGVKRPIISDPDPDIYVGDGRFYSELCDLCEVQRVDFAAQVRETAKFLADTANELT